MHRTGRRLYSIFDLCELAIIVELSMMVDMPPASAAAVAAWARKRGFERTERDAFGKPKFRGTKHDPGKYLRVWIEDGFHKISLEEGTDWFSKHSHPHPFIVVPLDDVIHRVELKAFDVLEREFKKQYGGAE